MDEEGKVSGKEGCGWTGVTEVNKQKPKNVGHRFTNRRQPAGVR